MKNFIASAIGASLVLLSAAGCIFLQGFEDHSHFELKPLFVYALAGRLDKVKQCVETNGDANGTDAVGQTALMGAVVHDHVDVVRYLLLHGGNPWLKDNSGETALDIAKMGAPKQSVKVLEDYMARHSVPAMTQLHAANNDVRQTTSLRQGPLPYDRSVHGDGFVTSPYAPEAGYVDVRQFRVGERVRDPYTGQIFIVPPRNVSIGIVPK